MALMLTGRQALARLSREDPLDCPHEPNAQNLAEHEAKPYPQIHFLSYWQGFQVAGLHLVPSGHSSLQLQYLSPFLLVGAPIETSMMSP